MRVAFSCFLLRSAKLTPKNFNIFNNFLQRNCFISRNRRKDGDKLCSVFSTKLVTSRNPAQTCLLKLGAQFKLPLSSF